MSKAATKFFSQITPPLTGRCWVAFSGGMDSNVLLHALAARHTPGLRAVHVHHGLQAAADDWVRHCRSVCRALGVPLTLKRVRVSPQHPGGPEAAAREARHSALRSVLRKGDVLALAHHRDDQAETVLLRALRGSGIAGLAAMRDWSPPLWRPLLDIPREALRHYAQEHGLHWIEDPHNADPRYARSWLRAQVLPALRARWPQADESLFRLARHAHEAQGLLDERAAEDLSSAQLRPLQLRASSLLGLSAARRHNLLRYWLAQQGEAPSAAWLARFDTELLRARPDAAPLLKHDAWELRRYRDVIYLLAALPPAPRATLLWAQGRVLSLPPGCGLLRRPRGAREVLRVTFGDVGARIRLAGETKSRSLKNLFQAAGVPPWSRLRTPLVWLGSELVQAGAEWRSERGLALNLVWQADLA